ncbi:MAG TPA: trimethylamine methyltransferase family protein [Gaiellales bacterium]|jgi:trimethylamine--corrinoid protein Co-methyltransferase|nr:trimethylamine methyltransferase family protein [Gaiellales bacterium]
MFSGNTGREVLSEEQIDLVHERAMTVLEEIGTDVRHPQALELLTGLGQKVDGERVHWDREFIMEMLAKAPSAFTLQGRNPDRAVRIGDAGPVLTPVGGSPFCSDLERGRRDGTYADHVELVKMAHAADLITCHQSGTVEAADLDENTRHMDMDYSILRYSDKPHVCYGTSGYKARDAVALAAIACGGREAIERTPALLGVVNPNSPLVWDFLMVDALTEWATAGQPVVITPFLLAGATAPITIASGLVLKVAEALSGVALVQAIRAGSPVLFGSFFTAVDMRTGGPSFGTPESVLGTLAGGQLARRYRLPYRGGGGLCSSNALDMAAAAETSMTLWATMMAGSHLVMHAAGWLEGGLTASYEKFAFDLELLRMFTTIDQGIETTDERFAIETMREEGPGGMFLAAGHTLDHFREWMFMSPLFRSQAYVTWQKQGSLTADRLATAEWKALLERYEDPGIDDAVDEELREYMARRRAEIGTAA